MVIPFPVAGFTDEISPVRLGRASVPKSSASSTSTRSSLTQVKSATDCGSGLKTEASLRVFRSMKTSAALPFSTLTAAR